MKGKVGYLVPRWPGSWDEDDSKELEFKTEQEYDYRYYSGHNVTRIVYFEVEDVD